MDSTDVRILCEMAFRDLSYNTYADKRVSPSEVGKMLRLDEKTVRARVLRMEDSGFIKYYQAVPNLAVFGMRSLGSYRLEVLNLATKYEMLRSLHEIPRLVETIDYLGPYLTVTVAGPGYKEVQEAIDRLSGKFESRQVSLGSRVVREPLSKLDQLDWQVMRRLRYDARSTTKDLAKHLSITPRMAAYRIAKLLKSGTVFVRAVIDPRKQAGLVFYELEMLLDDSKQTSVIQQLRATYGERLWSITTPAQGVVLFSMFAFSLGEPEDSAIGALKLDGVKRCSLFILKEVIEPRRSSWVDELIDSRVEAEVRAKAQ
jgi:DNA-binding Lrp family transcriptional regulator